MARMVIALSHTSPPVINEDEVATEAIIPGHLVQLISTGWRKNQANAANVAPNFALEREELGNGIDTAYAINDVVKVGAFCAGQRVYAFLASGQNVAKGDYLTGDAAGLLTATGVTAQLRVAKALEAINATAGPVAGTRIRVEIV